MRFADSMNTYASVMRAVHDHVKSRGGEPPFGDASPAPGVGKSLTEDDLALKTRESRLPVDEVRLEARR